MKKVVFSLIMSCALLASAGVMAQDNTKKVASEKKECPSEKKKSCTSEKKEAKKSCCSSEKKANK